MRTSRGYPRGEQADAAADVPGAYCETVRPGVRRSRPFCPDGSVSLWAFSGKVASSVPVRRLVLSRSHTGGVGMRRKATWALSASVVLLSGMLSANSASADTVLVTCTGTNVITYEPGITYAEKTVHITGRGQRFSALGARRNPSNCSHSKRCFPESSRPHASRCLPAAAPALRPSSGNVLANSLANPAGGAGPCTSRRTPTASCCPSQRFLDLTPSRVLWQPQRRHPGRG